DPGPQIGDLDVAGGIGRQAAVERDVAALRADDELLAWHPELALEEEERLPDHPLAALCAVVDRRVAKVAAEVDRVDDRLAGAPVDGVVLVAEIGPEADR